MIQGKLKLVKAKFKIKIGKINFKIGERIKGVKFSLSGEHGIYDIYRVEDAEEVIS